MDEPFPMDVPPGCERRWFRAGALALAIDRTSEAAAPDGASVAGAPPGDDADAEAIERLRDAVLLGEHDLLLDALDDWLSEEGDWRPGEAADDEFDVTLRELESGRRIGLAFGEGAPPTTLAALPRRWRGRVSLLRHRSSAELVLDRFPLGAEDTARWAPGSVVILPGSFRSGWRPVLAVPSEDEHPSTAAPGTAGADAEGVVAFGEAVLAERFEVDTVRLATDPIEALSPAAARALDSLDGRRGRVRLRANEEDEPSSEGGTFARFGTGFAFVIDAGADAEPDVVPDAGSGTS